MCLSIQWHLHLTIRILYVEWNCRNWWYIHYIIVKSIKSMNEWTNENNHKPLNLHLFPWIHLMESCFLSSLLFSFFFSLFVIYFYFYFSANFIWLIYFRSQNEYCVHTPLTETWNSSTALRFVGEKKKTRKLCLHTYS